jgi:hypothetical protein
MVSPLEWIDVQATDVEGQPLSWVRRYRPARPTLVEAAGFEALTANRGTPGLEARAAAVTPDVDDMIEASRTVDAEAVRAWVAEMNDPFDLDSRRLIRLADAGVPASVIDVMVAVSYPKTFTVQRDGDIDQLDERDRSAYGGGYGRRVYLGSSIWSRPFYYSPFGYGYGYGPYGYGGFYPYGGYYQPGIVIVTPRADPAPNARVVRGRGYTRGTGATDSGSDARRSSPPAGGSRQPSAGGSSSGGGSSAPGSGGGSSEGRTARPR